MITLKVELYLYCIFLILTDSSLRNSRNMDDQMDYVFNVYAYTNIYISLLIFALYLISTYSKDIQGVKFATKGG